eukprot:2137418-Lingulodinium_polyedra.AAC.1
MRTAASATPPLGVSPVADVAEPERQTELGAVPLSALPWPRFAHPVLSPPGAVPLSMERTRAPTGKR